MKKVICNSYYIPVSNGPKPLDKLTESMFGSRFDYDYYIKARPAIQKQVLNRVNYLISILPKVSNTDIPPEADLSGNVTFSLYIDIFDFRPDNDIRYKGSGQFYKGSIYVGYYINNFIISESGAELASQGTSEYYCEFFDDHVEVQERKPYVANLSIEEWIQLMKEGKAYVTPYKSSSSHGRDSAEALAAEYFSDFRESYNAELKKQEESIREEKRKQKRKQAAVQKLKRILKKSSSPAEVYCIITTHGWDGGQIEIYQASASSFVQAMCKIGDNCFIWFSSEGFAEAAEELADNFEDLFNQNEYTQIYVSDQAAINFLRNEGGFNDGGDFILYLENLTTKEVIIDELDTKDLTLEECEEFADVKILK